VTEEPTKHTVRKLKLWSVTVSRHASQSIELTIVDDADKAPEAVAATVREMIGEQGENVQDTSWRFDQSVVPAVNVSNVTHTEGPWIGEQFAISVPGERMSSIKIPFAANIETAALLAPGVRDEVERPMRRFYVHHLDNLDGRGCRSPIGKLYHSTSFHLAPRWQGQSVSWADLRWFAVRLKASEALGPSVLVRAAQALDAAEALRGLYEVASCDRASLVHGNWCVLSPGYTMVEADIPEELSGRPMTRFLNSDLAIEAIKKHVNRIGFFHLLDQDSGRWSSYRVGPEPD